MKEKYTNVEIDIIKFTTEDVITTSGESDDPTDISNDNTPIL